MPRIVLTVTSVVLLLACFALAGWYLTHPDSWNWRDKGTLAKPDPAPDEAPESSLAEDTFPRSGAQPRSAALAPRMPNTVRAVREQAAEAECKLPATVSVSTRQSAVIYSWRNEKGTMNFSSQPPPVPTLQVRTATYWQDPQYFELDVAYRGGAAIPYFRDEIAAGVTGIYRVVTGLVGEENLRKVDLNIVIYPDHASYLRYANSSTGRNMDSTSGFYSVATNTAATYVQDAVEATKQTALHESTHVINAGILGRVPVWLNEGLAEYFARLEVVGQADEVTADEQALQLVRDAIRGAYPRRLRSLFALTPATWREANTDTHYALAGGLLFFLMGTEERRDALSSVLRVTAAQYCRQLDTTALLDEFYPGGLDRLDQEFFAWLQDKRPRASQVF